MTTIRTPTRIIPRAFPGIKTDEIEELISFCQVRSFNPGAVLCREGAAEDKFYMILEGEVEVTKVINNSETRLLKTLSAGDFFGAQAKGNWFAQAMINPGAPVRSVQNLTQAGVTHQWAYLPDVARTMVALLAERARLPAFNRFHMAGHVDRDGSEMAAAVARVVARHGGLTPKIGRFPLWLIDVLSPFLATFREMREMRYLWRESVWLDNTKLVATLGHEPHTPLDAALEASLRGLGCLPAASESSRRVRSGQAA